MRIKLSDHFTFSRLLRFTLPSISMMIFTSIYGVVDGFFVSNFAGGTEFAAVNFIMPFLMLLGGVGFMFGSGGNALVAKTLGEGDGDKAKRIFSLLVYSSVALGIIFAAAGIVFLRPVAVILGSDETMLPYCVKYGQIILLALPFFILQNEFQSFFIAAEKPKLGLVVTLIAGVMNMALDALFVAVFRWGVVGAAAATAISQFVGGVIPLVYFLFPNDSLLRLGKTKFNFEHLAKASGNGASEFVVNMSLSLVNMVYNYQLMRFVGKAGVAAYGTFMYESFIFVAIFIGFTAGSAPLVSYNYGAKRTDELKSLFKKSLVVIFVSSLFMVLLGVSLAYPLSAVFVGYDAELYALTSHAIFVASFSFLLCGLGIFASGFFTALGDGLTSAIVSFLRTFVFQVASVLVLPVFWGVEGVWLALVCSEILSACASVVALLLKRKKYQYV